MRDAESPCFPPDSASDRTGCRRPVRRRAGRDKARAIQAPRPCSSCRNTRAGCLAETFRHLDKRTDCRHSSFPGCGRDGIAERGAKPGWRVRSTIALSSLHPGNKPTSNTAAQDHCPVRPAARGRDATGGRRNCPAIAKRRPAQLSPPRAERNVTASSPAPPGNADNRRTIRRRPRPTERRSPIASCTAKAGTSDRKLCCRTAGRNTQPGRASLRDGSGQSAVRDVRLKTFRRRVALHHARRNISNRRR
ncbi:MAG: hypothetical protein JMDDDDMK_04938 [Acidobacteria bacterium]|nr:hypothetical protein [Acidobacteriota bacterium]